MSEPKWFKENKWELDKVIADPVFQKFVDEIFACEQVQRITLLGSIAIDECEPFNRYTDAEDSKNADIDMGVELKDKEIKEKADTLPEIKKVLEPFEWWDNCFLLPSPRAPMGPFGKKYRIHIEGKPYMKHVVLKER